MKTWVKTSALGISVAVIICIAARAQLNNLIQGTLTPAQDSIVQITAEAMGLEAVALEDLPRGGTYWWVYPSGVTAPVPFPPTDRIVPIYAIAEGQFLVDVTDGQVAERALRWRLPQATTSSLSVSAVDRLGNAVADLIEKIQQTQFERTMMMSLGFPSPGEGGGGTNGSDYGNYSTYTIDTNLLWLEITNVSNGWSHLSLYSGTNQFTTNQVFAILTKTNLLDANWNIETIVFPTPNQTNVMPFTVQNFDREILFFRAQDWTGADSDGDGIPNWWIWKYFHTLSLNATNLDSKGNTLGYDYTNHIDPNAINFTIESASQYASTSYPDLQLNVTAGVPSYYAVLVDNTNFTAASWSAYTSPNITVNLGSNQGSRNVWVGLRGLPADAQQTWETTSLSLDSTTPTISITSPANNVSFNSSRVNVSGNFAAGALKLIIINGVPAFIHGTNFNALNVPLDAGTNTLTATVENLAGVTNTVSINLITTTNSDGSLNNPVQLQATPVAGFSPLSVSFQFQTNLPGTIQQVAYDLNGDDLADFITNNLAPITYTYTTNGEYFPVVTIQTTGGRFSSVGGWNGFTLDATNQPVRINVQAPPTITSFASVPDPVDIKWVAPSNLYVLSRSTATLTEFNAGGNVIRYVNNLGLNPSGFDVDNSGNVYVAVTGSNQVWKLNPTDISFTPDAGFGYQGVIGISGTNGGEFNAPYDVAVSPDGGTIAISDSGNHRIQRVDTSGNLIDTFGSQGTATGQFDTPKGLTYDSVGTLYVVDSGNNQIVMAQGNIVMGTSGTSGTDLGQFSGPVSLCVAKRGVYVADTGNNRIQKFDLPSSGLFSITPTSMRFAVSTNLSQPYAAAAVNNFTNDLFYVADTANNRVILCTAPSQDADTLQTVWNSMTARVAAADIPGAAFYFSSLSADKYRQAFLGLGTAAATSVISQIGTLIPATIESDASQYYFEKTIDSQTITFPVEFVKEKGVWKILEF